MLLDTDVNSEFFKNSYKTKMAVPQIRPNFEIN